MTSMVNLTHITLVVLSHHHPTLTSQPPFSSGGIPSGMICLITMVWMTNRQPWYVMDVPNSLRRSVGLRESGHPADSRGPSEIWTGHWGEVANLGSSNMAGNVAVNALARFGKVAQWLIIMILTSPSMTVQYRSYFMPIACSCLGVIFYSRLHVV